MSENQVYAIRPGMYLLSDIWSDRIRNQVIKDGYGYCISKIRRSFVRVEIIPDSEFYTMLGPVSNEEARAWYESFGNLEAYIDSLNFLVNNALPPD